MNRPFIKINFLLATLFLMLLSFGSVQAQTNTPRYGVSMTSNTGGFYEYLPQGYSATGTTLYPLIIMIHGMGEYGGGSKTTLWAVAKHGVAREIKNGAFPNSFTVGGKAHKFIVLTPQWKVQASAANVNGVINYALTNYKVDPKRIYLTGLSAGGGVVETAAADAVVGKRLAAVVEFCGTSTPSTAKAASIASNNVAFWGIHNKYDNVVSSSKTINYVDYILKAKSTAPARKTIPNGTSHNVWQSRYPATWTEGGVNIYQWMLQYQKGTVTTPANVAPVANASSDKTITLPASSVTLSGSGTDVDGTISKYAWSKVSGPSAYKFSSTSAASTTVTALVAGTYVFRLTVTDSKSATGYDDVNVVVNPAATTAYSVPGKVEAENYVKMLGVQKETTADAGGGQDVGYIDLNDWMEYNIKTTASGTFSVKFRVASGTSTGSQFQVKSSSGTVLATVTVPATGGYQSWKDVTASVNLVSGTQTLRLQSTKSARWNINYMSFISGTTSSTATSSTKIEAENYKTMRGVLSETTKDAGGGKNVTDINLKDYMTYAINVAAAGVNTLTFRVAANVSGGQLQLKNERGIALATVTIPNTGGTQTWRDVTASVTLPAGAQTLWVYSTAASKWNFNYFTYKAAGATSGTVAASTNVAEEAATVASGAAVTPNPFTDRFVLTVNAPNTGIMKVQLVDVSGVVRKEFQVMKSAAGTMQTYLSAGTLPAGNYFVKVQIGSWSQSKQIVKL